jgi:DNA polymerase I-like protein with 3'-5' exonuclease and polymerase domains
MMPYSQEAHKLLHDGALALARVESNGMRVDMRYLRHAMEETTREIKEKKEALLDSKVMKTWRRTFRDRANFNSPQQLGKVLFEVMGFESPGKTEGGSHKTDEASLEMVKDPFVQDFLEIKKLQKGKQFLEGIRKEVVGGLLRPSFNLHIPRTYRSSSDNPNFQNLPVRNEKLSKLVRRCIIPRKGRCLVEIDYGGIEVKIAYCYHKDPQMKRYLIDPNSDMHRDQAVECFKLPKDLPAEYWKGPGKKVRYSAKNQFVFPQFYGNFWMACARDMWNGITTLKLEAPDGVPMLKHLRRQGIKRLGDQDPKGHPGPDTFEAHIKAVEDRFWNKRFRTYTQWKKDWYSSYQKKGWFRTLTGFICQGYMARNECLNYPIQGSAFHCLLWALIQLQGAGSAEGLLAKKGMRSMVVGQIHDSIVADVPEEEVEGFLSLCHSVMVKRLPREWPWIITPLEVEAEVTPVGGSWVDKKGRVING